MKTNQGKTMTEKATRKPPVSKNGAIWEGEIISGLKFIIESNKRLLVFDDICYAAWNKIDNLQAEIDELTMRTMSIEEGTVLVPESEWIRLKALDQGQGNE
jgi:hypothetical protein